MTEHDRTRRTTLRSDAERNRDRLVQAAREAFRELGADVPMKEIARRAGVGTATLYRRFPTREDLLEFVFTDRLTACEDLLRAALTNPSPWEGLVEYLTHVTSLQLEDRAFTAMFFHELPADSPAGRSRREATTAVLQLLDAAKAAGDLRQDAGIHDIVLLLKANDGVLRWATNPAEESRALLGRFLSAIHA